QTDTQWIEPHLCAGRREHEGRIDWQRFHPPPQLSYRVVGLAADVLHIGPIRIDAVAAEDRPQRTVEPLGRAFPHPPKTNQMLLAPLRRAGRAALEVLAVAR